MSADGSSPSATAGEGPAAPAGEDAPALPACAPEHGFDSIVDSAPDAGGDVRPGRAPRTDGCTPERIRWM